MNIEKTAKKYFSLTEEKKEEFLTTAYITEKISWIEIAELVGTYPNRVRRDATKLGIASRNKAEAQRVALQEGRSKHPTEGKEREEKTKRKISVAQGEVWDNLSAEEKLERSEIGKGSWENKTPEQKAEMIRKGGDAIREAAKTGSKLERFLLGELTKRKYKVQFHRVHWLKNQKLETDLFVEDLLTVIEVDGPSHFEPVWGEENLKKNQRSDLEKTALILNEGLALIRIKQKKRISQRYLREILDDLLNVLEEFKKSFPKENKRYVEL